MSSLKLCSGSLCSGIIGVILAIDGSSLFLDTAYTSYLFKTEPQWLRICDIGHRLRIQISAVLESHCSTLEKDVLENVLDCEELCVVFAWGKSDLIILLFHILFQASFPRQRYGCLAIQLDTRLKEICIDPMENKIIRCHSETRYEVFI